MGDRLSSTDATDKQLGIERKEKDGLGTPESTGILIDLPPNRQHLSVGADPLVKGPLEEDPRKHLKEYPRLNRSRIMPRSKDRKPGWASPQTKNPGGLTQRCTPEVLPQVLLVMASISHAAGVSQKGRPGTGILLDGPYLQWDYEAALVPMASSSRRQMSWTPVTVFCSISAETTLFPSRSPKTTLSVRVPDS